MEIAKEKIAKNFDYKVDRYSEIFKIIDSRWEDQLHQPLHAAGYYLNPELYYDNAAEIEQDAKLKEDLLKCIARLSRDNNEDDMITSEFGMYTNALGIFGTPSAIRQRKKLLPAQWWKQYGTSTPTLRRFAIKVLSLTCSSSGCERNWSVFEHLHSKKRNRLTQKKLNDLVYIKYNRALRRRFDCRDKLDPIMLDDASVEDANALLMELDEDTLVIEGEDLPWGVVAEAMGVNEAPYRTRKSKGDHCKGSRKGNTSNPTPTSKTNKGKAPLVRIDEDEEEFDFEEESEEENDESAYKDTKDDDDDDEYYDD